MTSRNSRNPRLGSLADTATSWLGAAVCGYKGIEQILHGLSRKGAYSFTLADPDLSYRMQNMVNQEIAVGAFALGVAAFILLDAHMDYRRD